jgi:hypothetical protein
MSATRSGSAPDNVDAGSWATESLPMTVRKELLERELSRLGFRKAAAQGASAAHVAPGAQQQGDPSSSHPQADAAASSDHAE